MDLTERKITDFLLHLGLSEEEAKIYLALMAFGNLTILELSRKTGLPRASLYRKMENLTKIGVIEELVDEHVIKLKACQPDKLELAVKDKELLSQNLRVQYPDVVTLLNEMVSSQQPDTKVLFYRGFPGIRQMVWNVLKTKHEICGYSYRTFIELVGNEFAKDWIEEFGRRGLFGRDLYSDEFLKSQKEHTLSGHVRWKTWESRYIPAKILNINHQMDIYNDVVSFYNWHEGEVFGVEIYNEKVASLQKQIFEVLWKMGTKKN